MRYLALIFLLLLLNTSCKKTIERVVEVEKKTAWSELKSLSLTERIQHNAISLNDSVILFNNKNIVQSYNANTLQKINAFVWGFGEDEISNKPSLDQKILVKALKNYIEFSPVSSPITERTSDAYSPAYANDLNFIEFQKQYIKFNQQFPVIRNKYVLAPFVSKKTTSEKNYANLFRLNMSTVSGYEAIKIDQTKEVELTSAIGPVINQGFYSANSYFDKFFLSIGDNTFRVDTAGNVKAFGAPMYSLTDMFRLGNFLFGVNPNGRFYVSSDAGENWNLFTNLENTIYGFIGFEQVGDEVFAFVRDQIWQVTLTGNTLDFIELKNEGLERSVITSICRAGDKVFITTLFGVYYRKWSDFKEKKSV